MVGITPPVENAYSVKRATNLLGIYFSQRKPGSSETARRGKKMDILWWEIGHLHLNPQMKMESHQNPNSLLLAFDALGFLPRSWKHLFFQWSIRNPVTFMGTLIHKILSNRGVETTEGSNFHLVTHSPFPSFPINVHSQALQYNLRNNCLDNPFLRRWEKLSAAALHLLFFSMFVVFVFFFPPLLWSNQLLFLASLISL